MTAPADFLDAFKVVLRHEGGYSDHASDRGGATRWGVTEAVARHHGYKGDMAKLPLSFAESVYRKDYWDPLRLSELPASAQSVATYILDCSVNHGPKRATVLVQRAIRNLDYTIKVDGKWGPKTQGAVLFFCNEYPQSLLGALKGERWVFYKDIVGARNDQRVFIRGWAARCS